MDSSRVRNPLKTVPYHSETNHVSLSSTEQVDFHFVNERRRYVVTQLERERAMGNHPPPDLEARNQASPTVNASRSPDERYQRRYSGRMGRRGSRFSHGSNGSTSTNVSGGSDGIGHSKSL